MFTFFPLYRIIFKLLLLLKLLKLEKRVFDPDPAPLWIRRTQLKITWLFEELPAELAGQGHVLGYATHQLDDVGQVVLITAVVLTRVGLKQVVTYAKQLLVCSTRHFSMPDMIILSKNEKHSTCRRCSPHQSSQL
jgi:hypothetical protein